MIRRHPHIFETSEQRTASQQRKAWEDLKAEERKSKNKEGILDDVAMTLPSMIRALKLQKRAARIGFDWENPEDVIGKVKEELNEVIEEMNNDKTSNNDHLEGEMVIYYLLSLILLEKQILIRNKHFHLQIESLFNDLIILKNRPKTKSGAWANLHQTNGDLVERC